MRNYTSETFVLEARLMRALTFEFGHCVELLGLSTVAQRREHARRLILQRRLGDALTLRTPSITSSTTYAWAFELTYGEPLVQEAVA